MAPALRKPKSKSIKSTQSTQSAQSAHVKPSDKRKAIDDASPVSAKKRKAIKVAKVAKVGMTPEEPDGPEQPEATNAKKPKKDKKVQIAQEPEEFIGFEQDESPQDQDSTGGEEADTDLKAFTGGIDSSGDDNDNDNDNDNDPSADVAFKPGQDVGKIPSISAGGPKPRKPTKNGRGQPPESERGVMYIGRIPHGFYEHEMRQYFTQFGPVTRLRLSRNPRTGASRHFAFVEFAEAATADIAARTMNNYLLFGHILKCRVAPAAQLHPDLWKGANRRFKKIPWKKLDGQKLAQPRNESDWTVKIEREHEKRTRRAEKLKELGYEYDGPQLKVAMAQVALAPVTKEMGAE